jgi:hypothetical protein
LNRFISNFKVYQQSIMVSKITFGPMVAKIIFALAAAKNAFTTV